MRHHSTLNNADFNDTDEDSRLSIPHDDDDVNDVDVINQKSLMAELMSADDQIVSWNFFIGKWGSNMHFYRNTFQPLFCLISGVVKKRNFRFLVFWKMYR